MMAMKRWSVNDANLVKQMWKAGKTDEEIAASVSRDMATGQQVQQFRARRGFVSGRRRRPTILRSRVKRLTEVRVGGIYAKASAATADAIIDLLKADG